MRKKVTIKNLIDFGFLKVNEEIYMDFRGLHFTGRIKEGGKIETLHGIFESPSQPAYLNMRADSDFSESWDKRKENEKAAIVSGWYHWKIWNGTKLNELRKKVQNSPTVTIRHCDDMVVEF